MALKNAPHLSEISMSAEEQHFGVDGGTADPYLPSITPRKRWDYSCKWDMVISGPMKEFDLGKQPLLKGLFNKITGKVSLTNPEIHVVWRGLVPPSICRNDVVVTCRFTADRSEKMGLMSQHTHGMHLYMHHVFYPGHSITVGPGTDLPWAVGFSIPDFELDPKYVVAQVHVRVTGYFTQIPEYATQKDSELISIVPMDELVTGFAMSAPRVPNQGWILRGHKMGVDGRTMANKVKFLQEIGVDIEALRMAGGLKQIMKTIPNNVVKGNATEKEKMDATLLVNRHLKQIGN
ncbi:MAG: protein 3 [Xinjiang varicosavirus]|uniref:Protein 3 n=1 Tax=Xinjiang varicosavirus TaxID=3071319 RepID=A0AAJ4TXK9_9RHAB|nr:MAG: protein 3 [Xinjiang varicosa-like virus]QYF49872.1 MAG: protein 3 [Xinjiang varicosa-like virus]